MVLNLRTGERPATVNDEGNALLRQAHDVLNFQTEEQSTELGDAVEVVGGDTILHLAYKYKNIALASFLIENVANPFIVNDEGWLPIHSAGVRLTKAYDSEGEFASPNSNIYIGNNGLCISTMKRR